MLLDQEQVSDKKQIRVKQLTISLWLALAIIVRLCCLPNRSYDYMSFLDPWYEFIVQHGGFKALEHNFYDYTPTYIYWLVIAATWLSWLPKIVAIKLFPMAIDFLCAWGVYHLVKLKYPDSNRPIKAFLTILLAPTIFVNSALWGQCDVLYTTGLVGCIYFLCVRQQIPALLSYGVACAFKLQSIFLAPFLLVLWLKRRISWWAFGLVPLMYGLLMVPAALAGRPLPDLFLIYFSQAGKYKELTKMAPNFYQWISNDFYAVIMPLGLLFTAIVVLLLVTIVYRSRVKLNPDFMIQLSFTSVLMMPFLLPKMHDRYFFPADVMSIVFAFYFPKYYWMPIVMQISSLISYANGDLTPLLKVCSLFVGLVLWKTCQTLFQTIAAAREATVMSQP